MGIEFLTENYGPATAPRSDGCSSSPPQQPGAAEERERNGKYVRTNGFETLSVCAARAPPVRACNFSGAPAARSQRVSKGLTASQPFSIRGQEIDKIPAR